MTFEQSPPMKSRFSIFRKIESLVAHPHAIWWLGFICFIEGIFFPLPAEILFIPMVLARPKRFISYTVMAVIGSFLGTIAGYLLGYYSYDSLILPFATAFGFHESIESMRIKLQQDATMLWTLLLSSGLTHIPPIKVVTIGSGLAHVPFHVFAVSSLLGRVIRLVLLGWLLTRLNEKQLEWFKRHGGRSSVMVGLLIIGGLVVRHFVTAE